MLRLLTFLLLAISLPAQAELRWEALGGMCEQTRSEKGSWWNDYYPTSIDLTTRCYQLGVSDAPWRLGRWNTGWRASYVNLGRIKVNAIMAIRDDEQFSNPSGANCDPTTNSGCLIHIEGGGTAQGLSLGLLMERDLQGFKLEGQPRGGMVLGFEAGLFVYHNEFGIDVHYYPDKSLVTSAAPRHINDAEGWLATTYVGANLRYHWLMVSARMYQRITAHKSGCEGCSGITKGPAAQWNIGVSFPF